MEKETQLYEIGYLLNSASKDEEILSFSENLRNFIVGKNGLIVSAGSPKRQPLSYRIKGEDAAVFNWIKFTLRTELLKNVREYFDKLPTVLRFLVVKTKEDSARKTSPKIKPASILKTETAPSDSLPKNDSAQTSEVKTGKIPTEGAEKDEDIDKKIEELLGEN